MPTKVGIHAFFFVRAGESWMPTFVGVTVGFVGMTVGAAAGTHLSGMVYGPCWMPMNPWENTVRATL